MRTSVGEYNTLYQWATTLTDSGIVQLLNQSGATQLSTTEPVVARIHAAFNVWCLDYGTAFSAPTEIWNVFMLQSNLKDAQTTPRVYLAKNDVLAYQEFIEYLAEQKVLPERYSTANVTQVFNESGEYKAAWMTIILPDTSYFWIVMDTEWGFEVFHTISAVIARTYELVGKDSFSARIYGAGGKWPKVNEYTRSRLA